MLYRSLLTESKDLPKVLALGDVYWLKYEPAPLTETISQAPIYVPASLVGKYRHTWACDISCRTQASYIPCWQLIRQYCMTQFGALGTAWCLCSFHDIYKLGLYFNRIIGRPSSGSWDPSICGNPGQSYGCLECASWQRPNHKGWIVSVCYVYFGTEV